MNQKLIIQNQNSTLLAVILSIIDVSTRFSEHFEHRIQK